jgi:hypothetical protein
MLSVQSHSLWAARVRYVRVLKPRVFNPLLFLKPPFDVIPPIDGDIKVRADNGKEDRRLELLTETHVSHSAIPLMFRHYATARKLMARNFLTSRSARRFR